ncbi:hypothetical protein [Sphingobium baderi]|uniref:hypothetical protein n=1 Tax=Sphingobium baderi TaxID=1332080 RepID=UPI0011DF5411|nr:hypothetical protein [Sphingobium baderi]
MIRIFLAKNAIVGFGVTDAFAFERHPHRMALASDCRPVPSPNFQLVMPGVHFRAHSAFPSRKPPGLLLDPCRSRFRTNFRNDLQASDFSGLAGQDFSAPFHLGKEIVSWEASRTKRILPIFASRDSKAVDECG